ncbi:H-NS family nucleoid-associated regulatory protein [Paracoccus fontiphilus]|uniref:H-NS family nucleoid-associated regulatory protein n=1 Tax=Paracoccus fontiphilus TaxID=1815556 RepID=A0ABV7IE58_9RHOB|nr:H-NS histone family protein [Paracoccus fontiphilus]
MRQANEETVIDINYNDLSLEQLKEINKKSAAAIADFENRQKKEAIQKATEIAKAAGFASLEDMLAAQPAKQKAEPKYRHPENSELTWSGRGRKPGWIAEALESGKSLDDFAI